MLYPSSVVLLTTATLGLQQPRFVAQTIDRLPVQVHGMAVGDVDGDGKLDVLLVDSNRVSWYRNGDWKRFVLMDVPSGKGVSGLAVRNLDGDGRAEIAVCADDIYYLIPPVDPTQSWTPVSIGHAYGAHLMRWISVGDGNHQLVVLPSRGKGLDSVSHAELFAYEAPKDKTASWPRRIIGLPMPHAHCVTAHAFGDRETLYVGGDHGIVGFSFKDGRWVRHAADWLARGRPIQEAGIGEVVSRNAHVLATLEPPDRSLAVLYTPGLSDSLLVHDKIRRVVLDRKMADGHGLSLGDLLGIGRDQIVVGWRTPNADGLFGIKLYVPFNRYWEAIDVYWIDYKGIAIQGLDVADLDGDGKLDIVAYGGEGQTDLKIYWNRSD